MNLQDYLNPFPFIAITRGITPDLAGEYSSTLADAGFRMIETPLNSPNPLTSIEHMAKNLSDTVLVGAGTVTQVSQVQQVKDVGGSLIISPFAVLKLSGQRKKWECCQFPAWQLPPKHLQLWMPVQTP